jgi:hypothetical protein
VQKGKDGKDGKTGRSGIDLEGTADRTKVLFVILSSIELSLPGGQGP